jgi:hypothetical protein
MITLSTKSTFGNYAFSAEAAVTEEQRDALAGLGLLQILQRTPSTKAEKELAGYGKKRPEGFKRTDIAFSPAGAAVLKGFLEDAKVEMVVDGKEVEQPLAVDVSVSEYIPASAEMKWKDEKAKIASKGGDAAALAALAKAVGYTGTDLTEESVPFCQAIRAWVKEQAARL